MQARILNQSEEHLWNDFVAKHPFASIHQTVEWAHFRSQGVVSLGVSGRSQSKIPGREKYWILTIEKNLTAGGVNRPSIAYRVPGQTEYNFKMPQGQDHTNILAGTLLVRHSLPHGYCWLYAPRGPLLDYDNPQLAQQQMSALLSEIQKIAKHEKGIFLRVDPLIHKNYSCHDNCSTDSRNDHPDSAVSKAESHPFNFPHFCQNIHGFQPDHTLILDLSPSEEDLLKQMKPKGRYNIKLAEKKGVTIRHSTANSKGFSADIAAFHKILTETTSRDGFHGHDQEFYKNMLTALSPHATLYLAEYENQIIAGALNTFFKDTATYYYGASSNTHRNVMAPYLLHWQAIKDAKASNFKFYDFFGIAPTHEHSPHHPWAGVTEFKKKFGGTEVSYQLPQEFIFKKSLYHLYRIYKKLQ